MLREERGAKFDQRRRGHDGHGEIDGHGRHAAAQEEQMRKIHVQATMRSPPDHASTAIGSFAANPVSVSEDMIKPMAAEQTAIWAPPCAPATRPSLNFAHV